METPVKHTVSNVSVELATSELNRTTPRKRNLENKLDIEMEFKDTSEEQSKNLTKRHKINTSNEFPDSSTSSTKGRHFEDIDKTMETQITLNSAYNQSLSEYTSPTKSRLACPFED
ncbi:hypothetical protein HK096_006285, partial [Nowakowskiella sp. JEL0078]